MAFYSYIVFRCGIKIAYSHRIQQHHLCTQMCWMIDNYETTRQQWYLSTCNNIIHYIVLVMLIQPLYHQVSLDIGTKLSNIASGIHVAYVTTIGGRSQITSRDFAPLPPPLSHLVPKP